MCVSFRFGWWVVSASRGDTSFRAFLIGHFPTYGYGASRNTILIVVIRCISLDRSWKKAEEPTYQFQLVNEVDKGRLDKLRTKWGYMEMGRHREDGRWSGYG